MHMRSTLGNMCASIYDLIWIDVLLCGEWNFWRHLTRQQIFAVVLPYILLYTSSSSNISLFISCQSTFREV